MLFDCVVQRRLLGRTRLNLASEYIHTTIFSDLGSDLGVVHQYLSNHLDVSEVRHRVLDVIDFFWSNHSYRISAQKYPLLLCRFFPSPRYLC